MSRCYGFYASEISTWYGFHTRKMLRWYGFILVRSRDGMVFRLVRCQDGMVLILVRRQDGMVLILVRRHDGMVLILVRRWDGMVLITRVMQRWYGFGHSWGVWSDSATSWDVRGCVILRWYGLKTREMLVWFGWLVRRSLLVAKLVRRNHTLFWLSLVRFCRPLALRSVQVTPVQFPKLRYTWSYNASSQGRRRGRTWQWVWAPGRPPQLQLLRPLPQPLCNVH